MPHTPTQRLVIEQVSFYRKKKNHGSAKTVGKIISFTKGINFENSWDIVIVLVHCTFLYCDLSLSEVLSDWLLYFESYAPDKNPKLKFTKAITPKIAGIELWFLYTALLLNVIYLSINSKVNTFYTLEVMPRTKIRS